MTSTTRERDPRTSISCARRGRDTFDSLDHTVRLGIFIMNKRVSPEEFASDLLFREVPGDERGNVLRREYNAWTRSMLAKSSRSVRRDRIITIAVSADTLERAVPRLSQEADSFLRFMRDLGSDAHVLDGQQRLDIIQTMTRQDDTPGTANFERLSGTVGLTTRELVAPSFCPHRRRLPRRPPHDRRPSLG